MIKDVYILDFGSQYVQLIVRRLRALGVLAELVPYNVKLTKLKKAKALILSGGPASVYVRQAPLINKKIWQLGIPILGICYGMQLMCYQLGGKVERAVKKEYGPTWLYIKRRSAKRSKLTKADLAIFSGIKSPTKVWMSHGDYVTRLPKGFSLLATTANSPTAAIADSRRRLYGLQFHPEVEHTLAGLKILANFVFRIAGVKQNWSLSDFVQQQVVEIRETVGNDKVICAVSGGVDSTVVATLIGQAIGRNLIPIFVNHGFLRQGEPAQVRQILKEEQGLPLIVVNAQRRFLRKLTGVTHGETKRKIIGREFIQVFKKAVQYLKPQPKFLAQGTIHSDAVTSANTRTGKKTALIKSHHNVGGLPKDLKLKLIEPLRDIFKDEVREIGLQLGLPKDLVWRQPFPGPGLAIRIAGEVTAKKLQILRQADAIVCEEVERRGWSKKFYQYFAQLLSQKTVGIKGDERVYSYPVVVKIFTSSDVMTYDWARLPYLFLERLSYRLTNEVSAVTRVLYDISTKPPATVEWE